ncbi:MAG: flagellar biosynthesis protein FlhB [bacterium]|nr:flagellar biosynthesis protein FlhB [bacterium]
MATDKESKTEEPSSRRLQEAEGKGDIPRSKDMTSAVALFATLIFFILYMPFFSSTSIAFWKKSFSRAAEVTLTINSTHGIVKDFFETFMILVVPLFVLLFLVALMVEVVQGGGIKIVGERLRIQWDKVFFLSKIPQGLKKVVLSVQALAELIKGVVKVIVIGFIGYYTIASDVPAILSLPSKPLGDILDLMAKVFIKLSFNIILFLLILAVLDYLWQKHQYTKKLKMSKQDLKDEFKQAEGDPKVKGKQKQIQFKWAMQRMMQEVPEADVVITNPTHYAVALKYEIKKMQSPKLLAKGKNLVALKIKEIAEKHHVPVVENPPVARAVFGSVEIGEFIPEQLFKPVAEILAYIYKLKGKKVG